MSLADPPAFVAPPPEEQLHCPICDYDLRGLPEPRCPECGFRFTWEELRDPRRHAHRYLFEHHPERNVSSFFQTLLRGLRPGRFWRELHPAQPSAPVRLIIYWLVYVLPCLVPIGFHTYRLWQQDEDGRVTARQRM